MSQQPGPEEHSRVAKRSPEDQIATAFKIVRRQEGANLDNWRLHLTLRSVAMLS